MLRSGELQAEMPKKDLERCYAKSVNRLLPEENLTRLAPSVSASPFRPASPLPSHVTERSSCLLAQRAARMHAPGWTTCPCHPTKTPRPDSHPEPISPPETDACFSSHTDSFWTVTRRSQCQSTRRVFRKHACQPIQTNKKRNPTKIGNFMVLSVSTLPKPALSGTQSVGSR